MHEALVPPLPLSRTMYWCDRAFLTDGLEALWVVDHVVVGIILVSGSDAEFWRREHTKLHRVSSISVHRLKHQKCGGQSAPRFQRTRLNQIDAYIESIVVEAIAVFPEASVKHLVVAGQADVFDAVCAAPALRGKIRQCIRLEALSVHAANSAIDMGALEDDTGRALCAELFDKLDQASPVILYGLRRVEAAHRLGMLARVVCAPASLAALLAAGIPKTALTLTRSARLDAFGGVLGETYFAVEDLVHEDDPHHFCGATGGSIAASGCIKPEDVDPGDPTTSTVRPMFSKGASGGAATGSTLLERDELEGLALEWGCDMPKGTSARAALAPQRSVTSAAALRHRDVRTAPLSIDAPEFVPSSQASTGSLSSSPGAGSGNAIAYGGAGCCGGGDTWEEACKW